MPRPKPSIHQLPPLPPDDAPPPIELGIVARRDEAIRTGVLKALGRPAGLLRVAVVPLWSNHYRVNVMTGSVATTVNIPNSFFVTADDAGVILRSTPPMLKMY